jgi:hypothetical protein
LSTTLIELSVWMVTTMSSQASQGLINRVVHEHQMVQTRAVRRVTDVHARALAYRLQPFQDLDRTFTIGFLDAPAWLVSIFKSELFSPVPPHRHWLQADLVWHCLKLILPVSPLFLF